jgi:hypothetical protein
MAYLEVETPKREELERRRLVARSETLLILIPLLMILHQEMPEEVSFHEK